MKRKWSDASSHTLIYPPPPPLNGRICHFEHQNIYENTEIDKYIANKPSKLSKMKNK